MRTAEAEGIEIVSFGRVVVIYRIWWQHGVYYERKKDI